MNSILALQAIEALAALFPAMQALVNDFANAMRSNDEAALQATLAKLQATNDALMA